MVHCFAWAVKHREDVMSLGSNAKCKVKVECNISMHQAIRSQVISAMGYTKIFNVSNLI